MGGYTTATKEFIAEWNKYKEINNLKTYEEKEAIWQLCKMDYDTGDGIIPYSPSCDAFKRFHQSKARFRTVNAPNRMGKSLAAVADHVPMSVDPRGGCRGWLLAETYDLADQEWDYLYNMLFLTDLHEWILEQIERQLVARGKSAKGAHKYITSRDNPRPQIKINWPGSTKGPTLLEVRSFNNPKGWGRLDGVKLSWMIGCECKNLPLKLWNHPLKKRLTDKGALFTLPSTPSGEDEFMAPMFQRGLAYRWITDINYRTKEVTSHKEACQLDKTHVDIAPTFVNSYESWHVIGEENQYYNLDDYNADVSELFEGRLAESSFRERNYGEYVSKSGKFFDFTPEESFIHSNERAIHPDATIYCGGDIGSAKESAFVWVAIEPPDEDGFEQMIMFDEFYKTVAYSGDLADEIIEMNKKRGKPIERTVIDRRWASYNSPNSRQTVEEIMYDRGLEIIKNAHGTLPKHKVDLFYLIKKLIISGRLLVFKDKCPNWIKEYGLQEFKEPKYDGGHTQRREELADRPDHALDGSAYLLWTYPYYIKPSHVLDRERQDELPTKGSMAETLRFEESLKGGSIFSGVGTY